MRSILSSFSLLSLTMLAAATSHAALMPVSAPNHFEVLGAFGVATLGVGDGELGVTSSETDRLVQTNGNNWNNYTAQLGVGYVHYRHGALQYSENTQWFPNIEPQINAYYIGGSSVTGDVWRFDSQDFNQMTYSMPINSTRVMFDTSLTLASKKEWSLYAKGGIGNAWNRIGYSDSDNDAAALCADQPLSLNTHTDSSFVWEAGAGVLYSYNKRVGISLEYLYTDLGTVSLSSQGTTGIITAPIINSGTFNLNSQAVLLGLHVAV